MSLFESIKSAFKSLRSNKTRSALTMLGIVIGIASVVTMVSIGNGAQGLILGQIMSMGSNNIFVEPGAQAKEGNSPTQAALEQFEIKTLKIEDAEAIAKDPLVEMVAPYTYGTGVAVYKGESKKITYAGITPEANKIKAVNAYIGRDITNDDVKSMARVAVLGYKLEKDLFGDSDPIGKMVRIDKSNFTVVGVLEEQGSQMFQNYDDYAFLPLTTVQKILLGVDHIRLITVKIRDSNRIEEAQASIRYILRERHNIYNPSGDVSKDDFKVMSQKEAADIMTAVTSVFTIFLSSVAAIALLVGGIGIMNIMLVSVTERTKEIGLRKAVGARRSDILRQFLIEAMMLTLIGGLIGILLGFLFSYLASLILSVALSVKWDFVFPISAVIWASAVATIIGLVFGVYPARRAANLNPIEALRYE